VRSRKLHKNIDFLADVNVSMSLEAFTNTYMSSKWDEHVHGVARRRQLQTIATHANQRAVCALHGNGFQDAEVGRDVASPCCQVFTMYGPPTIDRAYRRADVCETRRSLVDNKTQRLRGGEVGDGAVAPSTSAVVVVGVALVVAIAR